MIYEFSLITFSHSLHDICNRRHCNVASVIMKVSFVITINKSKIYNAFKYQLVKNETVIKHLSIRCDGRVNTKKQCITVLRRYPSPSVCAVVALFPYTLKRISCSLFTILLACKSKTDAMRKPEKTSCITSCKIYKHLVQQYAQ